MKTPAHDYDFDDCGSGPLLPYARLDQIYHVTHIKAANRIVEDRVIQRRMLAEKSRLNKTNTAVVWLSPKTWFDGSQYGNVQIEFDFNDLANGKALYWVEAIKYPGQTACRFLLSDQDVGDLGLKAYRPDADRGPLKQRDGEWLYKRDITLEIMLDEELALSRSNKISFISHHHRYCRVEGGRCKDRGTNKNAASGRVLAKVLATNNHDLDQAFWIKEPSSQPSFDLEWGVLAICEGLGVSTGTLSGPLTDGKDADAALRAALTQYADNEKDSARQTARLISSNKLFLRRLEKLLRKHFGGDADTFRDLFP